MRLKQTQSQDIFIQKAPQVSSVFPFLFIVGNVLIGVKTWMDGWMCVFSVCVFIAYVCMCVRLCGFDSCCTRDFLEAARTHKHTTHSSTNPPPPPRLRKHTNTHLRGRARFLFADAWQRAVLFDRSVNTHTQHTHSLNAERRSLLPWRL